MTSQEAGRIVQSFLFILDDKDYSNEIEEAINMAIKALKQHPNDGNDYVALWEKAQWERDVAVEQLEQLGYSLGEKIRTNENCISRAQALHACCDEWNKDYKAIMKSIRQLPSVKPKTRWIPVSERLPEDYIHVLCQFTLGGMGECYLAHGVFHVVGGLVMTCNEVIAWTPLPEPYMAESEDRK